MINTLIDNESIIYLLEESNDLFNISLEKYVKNINNQNIFYDININYTNEIFNDINNVYVFDCISFKKNNKLIMSDFYNNIITANCTYNEKLYLLYTILFKDNNNNKNIIYFISNNISNDILNNYNEYYKSSMNKKYFYIYNELINEKDHKTYYYYPIHNDNSFDIYEIKNNIENVYKYFT